MKEKYPRSKRIGKNLNFSFLTEKRGHTNITKSSKNKGKMLHLNCVSPQHKWSLSDKWIVSSPTEEYLRVLMDEKLNVKTPL